MDKSMPSSDIDVWPSSNKPMEVSLPNDRAASLPDITMTNKTVAQPHQTDYLPDELVFALTQPPTLPKEKLGPLPRQRNLETSLAVTRRTPANVWTSKRREKFRHLTDTIPCQCGAGKDVSFLYDVQKPESKTDKKADKYDASAIRRSESEQEAMPMVLPDTLVPDEYRIVKNKGVLGLEYVEDGYGAKPEDHEKHLVAFPSMKPTSRYEVIQLQRTLVEMLDKIGVNDVADEVKGPTQIHNLLELIKKEQNVYNVIFHEIIRQTSIDCIERGKLLADLRACYSDLLNRVPKQIKGLHEEVMAQRALDRRLTEELMRFKSTISLLTHELSDVKQHDQQVSQEAKKTQQDLMQALAEAQKNAGLLDEYHDLYELQRGRLEKQSIMLAEEREVWSTAAYSLALKVMDEHFVTTAKRLHVSEKSWFKLGTHFTVLLSDQDTEVLTVLQTHVDHWREQTDDFNRDLCQREEDMRDQLKVIRVSINSWIRDFQRAVLTKDGQIHKVPDKKKITNLYNDIKQWQDVLNNENEKFGGDILLNGQDVLKVIHKEMEGWTECALKVFGRHKAEDGSQYPDHIHMIKMNEDVDQLLKQFHIRLAGENGVATLLIHLGNAFEMWDMKLNMLLNGSNPLPDQEWLRLYQLLDTWVKTIDDILALVGSSLREGSEQKRSASTKAKPQPVVDISAVMKQTQKWIASTVNGIDSEDAKLGQQVGALHTDMVKWMVQMLLRLAPDREGHSQEARDAVLLGSATIHQLQQDAEALCKRLKTFSYYVYQCCVIIVAELTEEKVALHAEDPDREQKDLKQLQKECDGWIHTAQLMLCELTGEPFPEPPPPPSNETTQHTLPPTTPTTQPSPGQPLPTEPHETQQQPTAAPGEDMPPQTETVASVVEAASGAKKDAANLEKENVEQPDKADEDKSVKTAPDDGATKPKTPDPNRPPVQPGETLEVLGVDGNTHTRAINDQGDLVNTKSGSHPGSAKFVKDRPLTPNASKGFEALGSIDILHQQLITTEERAQEAEDRARSAETELKLSQETVRALEKRLAEYVKLRGDVPPSDEGVEGSRTAAQKEGADGGITKPTASEGATSAAKPTKLAGKDKSKSSLKSPSKSKKK